MIALWLCVALVWGTCAGYFLCHLLIYRPCRRGRDEWRDLYYRAEQASKTWRDAYYETRRKRGVS